MRNEIDVIILPGFTSEKGKYLEGFQRGLEARVRPKSCTMVQSIPIEKASTDPETVVDEISADIGALIERLRPEYLAVLGHSVGGLYALEAVRRLNLLQKKTGHPLVEKFTFISIDSPLKSDVPVRVVNGLFRDFQIHYDYRATLAKQWEAAFHELDSSRIFAIGAKVDAIVPGAAKFFPDLPYVRLEKDADVEKQVLRPAQGYNFVLPPDYEGHDLDERRARIVAEIVAAVLAPPTAKAGFSTQRGLRRG